MPWYGPPKKTFATRANPVFGAKINIRTFAFEVGAQFFDEHLDNTARVARKMAKHDLERFNLWIQRHRNDPVTCVG